MSKEKVTDLALKVWAWSYDKNFEHILLKENKKTSDYKEKKTQIMYSELDALKHSPLIFFFFILFFYVIK